MVRIHAGQLLFLGCFLDQKLRIINIGLKVACTSFLSAFLLGNGRIGIQLRSRAAAGTFASDAAEFATLADTCCGASSNGLCGAGLKPRS